MFSANLLRIASAALFEFSYPFDVCAGIITPSSFIGPSLSEAERPAPSSRTSKGEEL